MIKLNKPYKRFGCDCSHCKFVEVNTTENIWIHEGIGSITYPESHYLKQDMKDPFVEGEKKTLFFDDARLIVPNPFLSIKPSNVVWFSHGSWLFDKYCEHQGKEYEEPYSEDRICKVAIIKNPKNIRQINTIEELSAFIEEFVTYVIDAKTHERKHKIALLERFIKNGDYESFIKKFAVNNEIDSAILLGIFENNCKNEKVLIEKIIEQFPKFLNKNDFLNNLFCSRNFHTYFVVKKLRAKADTYKKNYDIMDWMKVRKTGIYGLAFNFCKVSEFDSSYATLKKYYWHGGFDVESLMIFDTRAFDNSVSIRHMHIPKFDTK
jgi:hypothetical protein